MNAYFRRRLEAEWLAPRLASCPDCGLLCKRYDHGALGDLASHHLPWEHLPDWFLADVLRQGIAERLGLHRCPPKGIEAKGDAA